MRTNHIWVVKLISSCVLAHCLTGCGYTILRDFDEEARQREWVAIESLKTAPDLMISNLEYEHIPPLARQSPLGQTGYPAQVRFHITVTNVGNADFVRPYVLIFQNLISFTPYASNSFVGIRENRGGRIIPVDGDEEISLGEDYPHEKTKYAFTIVTNPIVQHKIIRELGNRVHDSPIPPLSREFRYDNNEATIELPGLREYLRKAQQQ